jgi:FHA domain
VTLDDHGVGEMRTEYSGASGPRTLVVVVDAPLLRGPGASVVDDVLRAVARELAPEDRVAVVLAGDRVVSKEWSAREMAQAGDRLASVAAAGGPRLYDALKQGASEAASKRRLSSGALLVVTLGEDRGSHARTSDVMAAALRGGVTSLGVVVVPGGDAAAVQQLERLSALTGGEMWYAQPGSPVPPSLGAGVRALLDRYRITFRDARWRRDETTHQLEVRAGDAIAGPAATRTYRPIDAYEPAWWSTAALWVVLLALLVIAVVVLLGRRKRQVCLLVAQEGEDEGQWYEVLDLPLRIGSGRENDIVIVRDGVSRNHCLLQREGRSVVLVDTNSEFGTFVNGGRVTRHELEEDDVIRLGTDVELAYEGR